MADPTFTVERVPIASLRFDPDNARTHSPDNVAVLKSSLERFGQRRPIVVWGDLIIAGNGTARAAKELGWTELFVSRVPKDWTVDEARAYAIADNRTAELSVWNSDVLAGQLSQLADVGFDLSAIGFDPMADFDPASFLDDLDLGEPAEDEDDDEVPDPDGPALQALPWGFTHEQKQTLLKGVKRARANGSADAPTAFVDMALHYMAAHPEEGV